MILSHFKKYSSVFILAFGLFLVGVDMHAQDEARVRKPINERIFNIGLKAGINVNRLSTSLPDYFNENYVGFKGGVFSRINIGRFHFQPEVNFSMTGGEGRFSNNDNRYYAIKLHAIEVPILLGFKVINFDIFNLRLNAGGWMTFNVGKSIIVTDVNHPSNNTFESSKLSSYDGGLVVGLSANIWRFTVDFRYQWGFVNILGKNVFVQDPAAKFRNGIFEFSVGFKIY